MIELSFVASFFAEFAFAIIFASFLFELKIKHGHAKSRLINLIFLFPFYTKMISFNFIIDLAILSLFLFYGCVMLSHTIKDKGKSFAIEDYQKRPLEPKYGLNDTIERINLFITVVALASIFTLISVFLGGDGIIFFIGIVSVIIIFTIMGNHIMNGHIKRSKKIYPNRIKVNLFTLFSLTLIFSILIFISFLFKVGSSFPDLLVLFNFISFFVVAPLLYVSNHLLDKSRLTFFKNKDVAKIFVSSITKYSITSLVIIIILSDLPVALIISKGQDIVPMIMWVNGFVIFITINLIRIYKKNLLFGLESKTIIIENLKCESSN